MSGSADLRALADEFGEAGKQVEEKAGDVTERAGLDIARAYKARARKKSGDMARSTRVNSSKGGRHVEVGPTEYYAVFQEEGTSSITADNALRNVTDEQVPKWQDNLSRIVEEAL